MYLVKKGRFLSKMKPRLRAESVRSMEGFDGRERERLVMWDICLRWSIRTNAVLEGFRESIFDVIPDDMSEIVS